MKASWLITLLFMIISGCEQYTSPIETLTPPIKITKNDTITHVVDKVGKLYVLTPVDRTDYRIHWLKIGDEVIQKTSAKR